MHTSVTFGSLGCLVLVSVVDCKESLFYALRKPSYLHDLRTVFYVLRKTSYAAAPHKKCVGVL